MLGAKYARAIETLSPAKNRIQVTDLTFAIFDELMPTEELRKLEMKDVIRYRKESEAAREQFLEHLDSIQAKQASVGLDGDYAGAITKVVESEIRPAVRSFRNKLQTIDESVFGRIAKGVVGFGGGVSGLTLFGELSWPKVVALTGTASLYVLKGLIDAVLTERAARRECSLSYILSLDESSPTRVQNHAKTGNFLDARRDKGNRFSET